ncbi:MAG: TraR/DksA family transcriptional regulator [Balneolaceae bacterium]|nr:MAG: TraR/DksA family transcriptional regulator [Balneolaceae bacterium]
METRKNNQQREEERTQELKTNLNENELAYFEAVILRKKEEVQNELDYLLSSVEEMRTYNEDEASSLSHHIGDLGSKEESMDLNYRLIQRNKKFLNELNRALVRIENGTYGICRATGQPIEKRRLEYAPHTRYSIAAKNRGLDKVQA